MSLFGKFVPNPTDPIPVVVITVPATPTFKVEVIDALFPTFKLFSIPTPPSTIRAPVSLLVESTALPTVTYPPAFIFSPTPSPPVITTAPESLSDEEFPERTSTVPIISASPDK